MFDILTIIFLSSLREQTCLFYLECIQDRHLYAQKKTQKINKININRQPR